VGVREAPGRRVDGRVRTLDKAQADPASETAGLRTEEWSVKGRKIPHGTEA
jgi:hypothetical protein